MTIFKPFAHTSGSPTPKIVFVSDYWSDEEEKSKKPLCGYTGKEFFRMLGEAFPKIAPADHRLICSMMNSQDLWIRERESWLLSAEILFTNTLNLRPSAGMIDSLLGPSAEAMPGMPFFKKGKFLRKEYQPHIERLWEELETLKPNLIVTLGAVPTWALTGSGAIGATRGAITLSTFPRSLKTLPTYHPGACFRNHSWRPILSADLLKAERQSHFAEIRRPKREILVFPTFPEMEAWTKANLNPFDLMAVDIETRNGQITDIGFATKKNFAMVITLVNTAKEGNSEFSSLSDELLAWSYIKTILEGPNPKLFQNGLYDLQYITKTGIKTKNCSEDTMLLHHSLYPEMQKSLGFMGSIYTDEAAWKLMRHNSTEEFKKDE